MFTSRGKLEVKVFTPTFRWHALVLAIFGWIALVCFK